MKIIQSRVKNFQAAWVQPPKADWRAPAACLVIGLILWPLVSRLPLVGWDWYYWFVPDTIDFYPPWTRLVLKPLTALPWRSGFGLLNSLTLAAVAVAAGKEAFRFGRASMLGAALLALLTPPVFWDLWIGNLEGIVLIGLLAAPPGVILALIKPNLTIWAVLSNRKYVYWAAAFGLVSLLIWGFWPLRMFTELGRLSQNQMAVGWYNLGWPVLALGVVLLVFSRPEPFQLMGAGFLLTPYLMPNHTLILLPVLGKLRGWKRLVLWGIIWLSGAAVGVLSGPARFAALSFPLAVWFFMRSEVES